MLPPCEDITAIANDALVSPRSPATEPCRGTAQGKASKHVLLRDAGELNRAIMQRRELNHLGRLEIGPLVWLDNCGGRFRICEGGNPMVHHIPQDRLIERIRYSLT